MATCTALGTPKVWTEHARKSEALDGTCWVKLGPFLLEDMSAVFFMLSFFGHYQWPNKKNPVVEGRINKELKSHRVSI